MTTTPTDASRANAAALPDVQAERDRRRVPIDKVGVKEIRYPVTLATREGGTQATVADVNMYVSLPAERKGTHMSRFLEALHEYSGGLTPERVVELCVHLRERLDAADAHVEMSFPYFIRKLAPVTGQPGLVDYDVRFLCSCNGESDLVLSVTAPATSLCPCSKEISAYGAHNQRCHVSADVRVAGMLWIEDLAEMIEATASCDVFSVLKRPDEKYVTERAFDRPKFVEDIVRDLAVSLDADPRIRWYHVRSENFESIHGHNAYAEIERDRRGEGEA